jgi:uncharacterized protein YndB with AHSA1/START domain
MDRNLKLTVSETIHAKATKVWNALTDSATIEKFMWGTHATSDWKKGSSLVFEGEYQGKHYREQGTILDVQPEKMIKYTYLANGLDDKPENYSIITYQLQQDQNGTALNVTQEGANDEKALEHSKEGWRNMLGTLKQILEK